MSLSLYGFVKGREPVSPEEIAAEFLSLPSPNGDARARVEKLVGYPPLSELEALQRREFHDALLEADAFEDLPDEMRARLASGEKTGE